MRVGIDVSSVCGWQRRLARTPAVRDVAFTDDERRWCGTDPYRYTQAWAVKEATVKLLGTGFDGVGWRGVGSRPTADGAVEVVLGPVAQRLADETANGPLTAMTTTSGHAGRRRVVAVAVAGTGRVATAILPVPATTSRPERHRVRRATAREAACVAVSGATGPRSGTPIWSWSPAGAPRVWWPELGWVAVSLSHDAEAACAAVGWPTRSGDYN